MIVSQVENLTIFHLSENEFDSAKTKNQCLMQVKTLYVAFVLDSNVEDKELVSVIKESLQKQKEDNLTVFVSGRTVSAETDYIGAFELVSNPITALLLSKRQIQRTGAFNVNLPVMANFEFLCRAVRETGKCAVRAFECAQGSMPERHDTVFREGAAETLAYMIRYHMNSLHALEMMDSVFSVFCVYAQREDFFSDFQQKINLFLSDENAYERIARQTAPFIILRGDDTCGGVLQGFADDLADALICNGQAVMRIDDSNTKYDELQNMVCKGIVGFQNRALEIDFFRKLHGPKFQFWFDNPLRFENVLRDLPEEYFILCQDANYAALIREYYHTRNAVQFPPGGKIPRVMSSDQYNVETFCKRKERPYDIVFVGTFFEDIPDTLESFEREFYDYMLLHPCETFEQGLSEILQERVAGRHNEDKQCEGVDTDNFVKLCCSLKSACRMVIGHFRNAIVSAILEAGFELHVYGDSWRGYEGHGIDNLKIHPYVTVEESLQELSKAKIGLNIMSWHKAGMTERVANIMLSGAVCLTEETDYLREHLGEGKEIVTFRLDKLDELSVKIRQLLESPDMRDEIAENAYRRAMAEYTWTRRAEELIKLSESAGKNALTVFVATHVKCDPPNDPIYVPLHVGRHGKRDLGYLGDDTGENISDLNFLYGELTGLFWIWQNVNDLDFAGLCHYRRYFLNSRGQAMSKNDYMELLEQYDAIVPRHAECDGSYYEHFGRSHNIRDLDAVGRALKRIYPSYGPAYDQAMEGSIFYGSNLMVTSLPILKAYAEWLFQIFIEASEEIDVSSYDTYHRRVYGFLSEQMFYVFALANELKCCELVVGISGEKAETKELKESLKKLLEENRKDEARRLFDEQLRIRPDLLLPGSDVNGELQKIYRLLSI